MSEQQQQAVGLDQLSIEQLAQIKNQLDEEIQHLTSSYAALKQAEQKFIAAKESVDLINSESKDKELLVPLTNSLYVPGKISDIETVLTDIGTGYYVEKSPKDAKIYYNTKALSLGKNLEELQNNITKKQENRETLVSVLQFKLSEREKSRSRQQQQQQ